MKKTEIPKGIEVRTEWFPILIYVFFGCILLIQTTDSFIRGNFFTLLGALLSILIIIGMIQRKSYFLFFFNIWAIISCALFFQKVIELIQQGISEINKVSIIHLVYGVIVIVIVVLKGRQVILSSFKGEENLKNEKRKVVEEEQITIEREKETNFNIPEYYTVHPIKLILLSIFSFSIYGIYWFYKNWETYRLKEDENITPYWRALFAPIFAWSFFAKIKIQAITENTKAGYNVPFFGTLYLLLICFYNIPGYLSLISLFSFIPLIFVQESLIDLNKKQGHKAISTKGLKYAEFICVLIGLTIKGLIIIC